VPVGDTANSRDGNRIFVKHLTIRVSAIFKGSATSCRIIFYSNNSGDVTNAYAIPLTLVNIL